MVLKDLKKHLEKFGIIMSTYESLKKIWKLFGFKGHVINFSSKELWVLETESGRPVAHKLSAMMRSPVNLDADGLKRVDGLAIEGHKSWWKIYDSDAEVYDLTLDEIRISDITKTAVQDKEFAPHTKISYDDSSWGVPIYLVTDVRRDKKRRIISYHVSDKGWVTPKTALRMTCHHEVANARPVIPKAGSPFIRTRRDQKFLNNLSTKGLA